MCQAPRRLRKANGSWTARRLLGIAQYLTRPAPNTAAKPWARERARFLVPNRIVAQHAPRRLQSPWGCRMLSAGLTFRPADGRPHANLDSFGPGRCAQCHIATAWRVTTHCQPCAGDDRLDIREFFICCLLVQRSVQLQALPPSSLPPELVDSATAAAAQQTGAGPAAELNAAPGVFSRSFGEGVPSIMR